MEQSGVTPDMPPLGVAGHLVSYLWDVGPAVSTGMGPAPVGHQDIAAFQANTGVELTAWDVQTLRRLSCDYVAQSLNSRDANAPAPYAPSLTQTKRAEVDNGLRSMLGGIVGASKKVRH